MLTSRMRMQPSRWTLSPRSELAPPLTTDILCHNEGHHQVGHDVSLKTLCRSADPDTPTLWYAQDAAGAIWRVDITASHTVSQPPHLLLVWRLLRLSVPTASASRETGQLSQWLCVWPQLLSCWVPGGLHWA